MPIPLGRWAPPVVVWLVAAVPPPLPAQDSLTARVDRLFEAWDRPASPGCALAVIRAGRIVYQRGYGRANLEHDIPIAPSTVFYVGSVSKQFTAAAVALLAQDGRVSLDDDVRRYIPELPVYGRPITIRQLIHHTSGLRDYYALRVLAGLPADGVFGDGDVLEILARQRALNFEPGAEHLYSNSGYFLLSVIVRRVTGQTLRQVAEARIFLPLGMAHTHFHDDHAMVVPGRASAYRPDSGGYRLSVPNFDVVGAGGLLTTVEDFLLWDRNFYEGTVGGRALIDQLVTPGHLNDGTALRYAFGLTVDAYRGRRIVDHTGSYGGYVADVLRFPDLRFSVACFCNSSGIQPSRLARQVADIYLAEQLGPAPRPDSSLATRTRSEMRMVRPDFAAQFAGTYHSDELDATYRIVADSARLSVQPGPAPAVALDPGEGRDEFVTPRQATLRFTRDRAGRVSGFTLAAGRVRGIRFTRRSESPR
ncbi:MAG: serine hydrolase domain-containing protein [Gemmatimonadales bacterium]